MNGATGKIVSGLHTVADFFTCVLPNRIIAADISPDFLNILVFS